MLKSFSRQELHTLVWSQPLRTLAASISVSDVALAKACRKASVPVPPRGYWVRRKSGKTNWVSPLPPRFPGAADRVEIGRDRTRYWNPNWKQEIAAAEVPPIPEFEESIEALAGRVRKLAGKVATERDFSSAFGDVAKLLAHDEERLKSRWSFDKPIYGSGLERRRLLLLHSLSRRFYELGCRVSMHTSKYGLNLPENRGIKVRVGDQLVEFTLDPPTKSYLKRVPTTGSDRFGLRLVLTSPCSSTPFPSHWDDAEGRLESRLSEISAAILIQGELRHREAMRRHRDWVIERKAQIWQDAEDRVLEGERMAREARAKQERARTNLLLQRVRAFQRAEAIRNYVEGVRLRIGDLRVSADEFERWAEWALAQADRIDPVANGTALGSPLDEACSEPPQHQDDEAG